MQILIFTLLGMTGYKNTSSSWVTNSAVPRVKPMTRCLRWFTGAFRNF